MVHLWVRAEQRAHEERVGLTPDGAAALVKAGHQGDGRGVVGAGNSD